MTSHRTASVLSLLACAALAGCLNVRHPLAESDAGIGLGDDSQAGNGGDPGYSGVAGAAGRAPGMPEGGGEEGGAPSYEAGSGGAWPLPQGGAAGDFGMPLPDGTFGGWSGGAVGGEGGWGLGGSAGMDWGMAGAGGSAPACCDDGDACTLDSCNPDGTCVHESIATMTDRDGDMVSDGCDCNDQNADIHPGQTEFFAESSTNDGTSMGAFDYDCDGGYTLLLTSEARTCEVYQGIDVCFGDGWLLSSGQGVPGCGSGGAYQACEFHDGACTATTLMMLQRCR